MNSVASESKEGTLSVAVVIPCFNVAEFVEETLDSVAAQTHTPDEVIVVDDGSTDETPKVLRRVCQRFGFRLIRQENAGASLARNTGVRAATADLIAFLDADDCWLPEKLEEQVRLHTAKPTLDASYCGWRKVGCDGSVLGHTVNPKPHGDNFEALMLGNFTGTLSTVAVRHRAFWQVGGFDASLSSNIDLDLLLRIVALRPYNIEGIRRVLVNWRQRPGQITSDWQRMWNGWHQVYEKMESHYPRRVARIGRAARAAQLRYVSYVAWEQGQDRTARRLLWEALTTDASVVLRDIRSWAHIARLATLRSGGARR
jgi:glycosyltransferase involved in cell wall biosynthesis